MQEPRYGFTTQMFDFSREYAIANNAMRPPVRQENEEAARSYAAERSKTIEGEILVQRDGVEIAAYSGGVELVAAE